MRHGVLQFTPKSVRSFTLTVKNEDA